MDGLHSSDLTAYIALNPNGTFATLAKQGVIYPNAYLPGPSDSFPGILALTTGNNVTVTGVYYGTIYAPKWLTKVSHWVLLQLVIIFCLLVGYRM